MARDRKRAKQRRERRGATAGGRVQAPSQPTDQRSASKNVPGALEHASGDVDEFDAALVRGAGGVTVPEESELETSNGDSPATRDEIQAPVGGGGGGGASGGGGGTGGGGGGDLERPSGAPLRGGNRVVGFLSASWAELQRVQWPDRRQVFQATAVVLGFVAIAGAYLGLADYVAKEVVEFIL